MSLNESEIRTLKQFYDYAEKEDHTPSGLQECDTWLDENADDNVINALGFVFGNDYLMNVPQSVQVKLPIPCILVTNLFDKNKAEKAVKSGKDYPACLNIEQIRKRAHDVLIKNENTVRA